MSTYKKILSGLAAFGMVVAPVAANAGTRAGDAGVTVAPVAQAVTTDAARAGASVTKENNLAGPGIVIAIIAGIAVIIAIIIAADNDDDGSPGS